MKTYSRLSKDALKDLRCDLQALLDRFEGANVKLTLGNCSYGLNGKLATFKLDAALIGEGGEVTSREASDFSDLASLYGFEPGDLNKEFTYHGKKMKIVGLLPRSHKFPILVQDGDRRMKYPSSTVLAAIGRKWSPTLAPEDCAR